MYLGADTDGTELASSTFKHSSVNSNLTLDGNKHTINYTKTFTTSQLSSGATNVDFYLKDISTGGAANAKFILTLLPATIGMTVSTSKVDTGATILANNSTEITNAKLLVDQNLSQTPIQLKYNEKINVTCDNTSNYLFQKRNSA